MNRDKGRKQKDKISEIIIHKEVPDASVSIKSVESAMKFLNINIKKKNDQIDLNEIALNISKNVHSEPIDDTFWAGAILGAVIRNLNDYSVVAPPIIQTPLQKRKTYEDFASEMEREYLTPTDTSVTGPSIITPPRKKIVTIPPSESPISFLKSKRASSTKKKPVAAAEATTRPVPLWWEHTSTYNEYMDRLRAGLPIEWMVCFSKKDNREYYLNFRTKTTQWDRPSEYPVQQ